MSLKVLLRLISFSLLIHSATAFSADVPLEFKAAYFYPTNHRFREIYPGGGPIYGLELSAQAWKNLYPWFSANYFSKSGHSIISGAPFSVSGDRTSVQFIPLALGLKYVQPINRFFDFYFGLGALATYLQTKDHASYVIKTSNRWGAGAIAKLGTFVNLYRGIFLDLAIDYSYMKVHFDQPGGNTLTRHTADLSGFSFGCGIGYRFGCRSQSRSSCSPCCIPTSAIAPQQNIESGDEPNADENLNSSSEEKPLEEPS